MDDLVDNYASSSDEGTDVQADNHIVAAPVVVGEMATNGGGTNFYASAYATSISHNLRASVLEAPLYAPADRVNDSALRNHVLGKVEDTVLSEAAFKNHYQTFHDTGVAVNPSFGAGVIEPAYVGQLRTGDSATASKKRKVEELAESEMANSSLKGPDMSNLSEEQRIVVQDYRERHASNVARAKKLDTEKATGSFRTRESLYEEAAAPSEEANALATDADGTDKVGTERSILHGKREVDYRGRSWIDQHPSELRANQSEECFIPKRQIHTWKGHTKGVNKIQFFPGHGHLLLSAGLDAKIKIWDVYNSRQVVQTYLGHEAGVRDICFSNDGRRFLSCSYDRTVKLWDTETGACIGRYSNNRLMYCAVLNPDADKQNEFLAGGADKKIHQWDTRTNNIVQVYDRHLAAVNTITFIDENRRFVSTSDDKSIRVWEYGFGVDVKYIADPAMHSMPAVTPTPNGKYLLMQSLDNHIAVYHTQPSVRPHKSKKFRGHTISGYACQVGVSPDGRYVMSGDTDGRVWFWDWKTSKIYKTLKCHKGVAIGCAWHPVESSKVATCGWDGEIKYWD